MSAVDHKAALVSLPPVDGMDLSAALLGVGLGLGVGATEGSPAGGVVHRRELAIGTGDVAQRYVAGLYLDLDGHKDGGMPMSSMTSAGPVLLPVLPLYKLLLGTINQDAHSGPLSPNRTMNATLSFPSGDLSDWTPDAYALECGEGGCLWDVRADPEERHNLAVSNVPPF